MDFENQNSQPTTPDNQTGKDNDIDATRLTKLPDGLNVTGTLDLEGVTSISKLPDPETAERIMEESLPEKMTKLPEGLHVTETYSSDEIKKTGTLDRIRNFIKGL